MARFTALYFIRNNAGTYEAWQDNEASPAFSGTALVTDVLNPIEAAHGSGDFAVLFGVGTFDMGTENWTLNGVNDVTIAGMGIGITVVQNSAAAAADTEPFSFTNCDRITIRDMDVSAGGDPRSTSDALDFDDSNDCLVERVRILASRARGIVFDGKDAGAQAIGNVIRDCIVTGTQTTAGSGIELLAADRSIISGCHIHDTVGDGIKIGKASAAAGRANAPSDNNLVHNNQIHNCGRDGLRILSSNRNVIAGNQILNSADDTASRDGIRIETTDSQQADQNIIRDNVIGDDQGTPTQRFGINVGPSLAAEAVETAIEGNVFFGNTDDGVSDGGERTLIQSNFGHPDQTVAETAAALTLTFDHPRRVVNVDSSGGTVTVTLPDNAEATGRAFIVRREGANTVTVARAGTDTIDGAAANKTLDDDGAAIGLISVGDGDWKVVSTQDTVT